MVLYQRTGIGFTSNEQAPQAVVAAFLMHASRRRPPIEYSISVNRSQFANFPPRPKAGM